MIRFIDILKGFFLKKSLYSRMSQGIGYKIDQPQGHWNKNRHEMNFIWIRLVAL